MKNKLKKKKNNFKLEEVKIKWTLKVYSNQSYINIKILLRQCKLYFNIRRILLTFIWFQNKQWPKLILKTRIFTARVRNDQVWYGWVRSDQVRNDRVRNNRGLKMIVNCKNNSLCVKAICKVYWVEIDFDGNCFRWE